MQYWLYFQLGTGRKEGRKEGEEGGKEEGRGVVS
jgi:hypothetical protein